MFYDWIVYWNGYNISQYHIHKPYRVCIIIIRFILALLLTPFSHKDAMAKYIFQQRLYNVQAHTHPSNGIITFGCE